MTFIRHPPAMQKNDADPPRPGVEQEPWDYDRFVETYNRITRKRGGWYYEADGRTPEEMRQRYRRSPETFPDLHVFAEGLVIWEQGLNL